MCHTYPMGGVRALVETSTEGSMPNGPSSTWRGGRRPGAGRPRSYGEPLLRKTVSLPQSYVEHLERYGSGNLSDGIRQLVENAFTRFGEPWLRPIPPESDGASSSR